MLFYRPTVHAHSQTSKRTLPLSSFILISWREATNAPSQRQHSNNCGVLSFERDVSWKGKRGGMYASSKHDMDVQIRLSHVVEMRHE